MEPTNGDLMIAASIVAVGVVIILGVWLLRRIPVKHEPGDFGKPREVMPTEDDIDPIVQVAGVVEVPALPSTREQGIVEVAQPHTNGAAKCRTCNVPLSQSDLVEFEDWQQVQRAWGRMLARFGYRDALAPGRRLHASNGLCRACAAIGDEEDRAEETRIKLFVASERRVWERRGRDDAIRRRNEQAERRYNERLEELQRSDTRALARTFLE